MKIDFLIISEGREKYLSNDRNIHLAFDRNALRRAAQRSKSENRFIDIER